MTKKAPLKHSKLPISGRIVMFFIRHIQQAMSSLGELWRNPLSSFMTMAVLGVSLSLPAALQVLVKNADTISQSWQSAAQISLFIKSDRSEQVIQSFITRLKVMPEIAKVDYISPEHGLKEFQQKSGFGDALSYLDNNPLPAVIVVTPEDRYSSVSGANVLLHELKNEPEVSLARLDIEWLKRLQAVVNLLNTTVKAIALLLVIAVILIIGNTIRLSIMDRRDEIEVMKLVGATESFIRRPFLYSGIWYGIIGGILAWLIINLLVLYLDGALAELLGLYDSQISMEGLGLNELGKLVFVASSLGWLGAFFSVRRQLKKIEPS